MSDRRSDEPNHDDESDFFWRVIEGISRDSRGGLSNDVDGEVERIRRAIFESDFRSSESTPLSHGGAPKVRRLGRALSDIEALIAWLAERATLTKTDVNVLKRTRAIILSAHEISVRDVRIGSAHALAGIFASSLVAGVFVGWVLFSEFGGPQAIAAAFSVGGLFGFFAGYIADRTYRFDRVRAKLCELTPWMLMT